MSHTPVNVEGIDLLEKLLHPLIDFKENLINGVFGKGKCGCPCRTYWVPKCEIAYVQQCHYDHYQNQVCNTVPVPETRHAKETECQRCRKYTVPTPATKWAIECNPVYDEKCKTSYPQHCKVEQRCHQLYQTVCDDTGYGYGGQTCGSVPREHCYPETKCHRTPMTECRPVQKEKCVKVPREVIVQKQEKQCIPFEINQSELDAQANIDPCAQQGFDYGGQAVGASQPVSGGYDVNVQNGGGSHHGHGGHVQQHVTNGYDVGPIQQHHQQAVNGYQIENAADHHHNSAGHGHDHGQAKNLGLNNIPVHNLYTVDAYSTHVPGGVLVNEPLPSNQYYAGRIGERRETPLGYPSQNPAFTHQPLQQQTPFKLQGHQNQINVAVFQDPILGSQQGGHIQYNRKRRLNPLNKSKNPFLRKKTRTERQEKRQQSLEQESNHSTSKPIRFEKPNARSNLDSDLETNTISDSVSSNRNRKPTKDELALEKDRFTSDSYEGWRPILYPAGR